MNALAWFVANLPDEISSDQLQLSRAKSLAALLTRGGYGGAFLTGCRRNPQTDAEVLLVDVDVGLGQRPVVNDIRSREPVAIGFTREERLPYAYPLREGFPTDVPHLNVALAGYPRSLCLYDAPPAEVRITYTALRLIERVRWWLRDTAYGRLHGDEQPLDPLFQQSGISFILPADFASHSRRAYVAGTVSVRPKAPAVLEVASPEQLKKLGGQPGGFAGISLITKPLAHGRMQVLPSNLEELLSIYSAFGADLLTDLREALKSFAAIAGHEQLLRRPLLLMVTSPLLRDGDVQAEVVVTKAFVTSKHNSGEAAQAIGALHHAGEHWGPVLFNSQTSNLSAIELIPADVYETFTRSMARRASGRSAENSEIQIALIGAGALGSQIAMAAAREGYGKWILIDEDFLLPHNLARHALGAWHIGHSKADRLGLEMFGLIAGAGRAFHGDVTAENNQQQLMGVDRIIDASASTSVARWLSLNADRAAPAASCFMNPTGTDVVVLLEGTNKEPRLDQLEMSYYWRLITEENLGQHLARATTALSVGSCRTPSVEIPQTRVMTLAGLATETLCADPWPPDGAISLWRRSGNAIDHISFPGELFLTTQLGNWTAVVRRPLLESIRDDRGRAGKLETGGILAGTWDRDRKIVYVIGHFDPPPDSVHEPTAFIRGLVGVHRTIVQVETATAGNMTYIGEWHTHPAGYGSAPSSDDEYLLRWVRDALQWSDAPAIILIAGGDGFRLVLLDSESGRAESVVTLESA